MKRISSFLFILFLIGTLAISACGGGGQPGAGEEGSGASGGETPALDRPEPPAEYANLTNPHAGATAMAEAGGTIYQTNCASCHGETGAGDGPAAAALDPKPQPLAQNEGGLSDGYMFWRISEGGIMDPFTSAMPAWKGILSEEQIWQTITYIRSLGG